MASIGSKTDAEKQGVLERALRHERSERKQLESLLASKSCEFNLAEKELKERHAQGARDNEEIENLRAELQTARNHLSRSASLAVLGELVPGVAHEMNNPIGFVMSNLGTLKSYSEVMVELVQGYREFTADANVDPGGELARLRNLERSADIEYILKDVADLVAESRDGTRRLGDIVQGLKGFSAADNSILSQSDLHQAIDGTLKIIANETKYSCEIIKRYGALPMIPCRLRQINQVLLNLLINAAQSIDDQGKITLTTRTDGQFAVVEISDTGVGIPQDEIGSIFDPFFTSSPAATGLGLSIADDIIRDHGGAILVESEVDIGSTFTVQLPMQVMGSGGSQ